MDWEAVGAIGEIVGALAVVATLGYLGLQIKAEARRVRIEANRDRARRVSESLQNLADSEHIVPLMAKMLRLSGAPSAAGAVVDATGLEMEDAIRYSLLRQAGLQAMQTTLLNSEIDPELRESTRRNLKSLIAQDGVAFAVW